MAQIFGILNITPDSFSDGGINSNIQSALKSAKEMIKNGVYAIDIGAESTRPNAKEISADQEISRLEQILPEIAKLNVDISLDTRNFETGKWGLENGVTIINDVSGFKDERLVEIVAKYRAKLCFMHSLTVPANPLITMEDENILETITKWGEAKINLFKNYKIRKENLIFDCGVGFGKTPEQCIFLLKNIEYFKKLGVKILIGHSRKSFLRVAFPEGWNKKPSTLELDLMTSIFSATLKDKVDFLRLHNTSIIKNI